MTDSVMESKSCWFSDIRTCAQDNVQIEEELFSRDCSTFIYCVLIAYMSLITTPVLVGRRFSRCQLSFQIFMLVELSLHIPICLYSLPQVPRNIIKANVELKLAIIHVS